MVVARADDQKAAHRQAVREIDRVLDGLRCRRDFLRSDVTLHAEIGVGG